MINIFAKERWKCTTLNNLIWFNFNLRRIKKKSNSCGLFSIQFEKMFTSTRERLTYLCLKCVPCSRIYYMDYLNFLKYQVCMIKSFYNISVELRRTIAGCIKSGFCGSFSEENEHWKCMENILFWMIDEVNMKFLWIVIKLGSNK